MSICVGVASMGKDVVSYRSLEKIMLVVLFRYRETKYATAAAETDGRSKLYP